MAVSRRSGLAGRRQARGYTQEALAEVLQVERGTVSRWERGSAMPSIWRRRPIAKALGVSLDELDRLLSPMSVSPPEVRERGSDLRPVPPCLALMLAGAVT